jgi:thioredoxin reductase (NADPH)
MLRELWAAFSAANGGRLRACLRDDVAFLSPAFAEPAVGADRVAHVLLTARGIYGDLVLTHELPDGAGGGAVFFTADVAGEAIQGGYRVDVVDGRVARLDALFRPVSATSALVEEMMARLAPPAEPSPPVEPSGPGVPVARPADAADAGEDALAADRRGAFPQLTDEQLAVLRRVGRVSELKAGDVLFRAGDSSYDLVVIESGAAAVVDAYGEPGERTLVVHGERRFLGELNLLTGQGAYLTAVMVEPGVVCQVSADALRTILAEEPTLSEIIMRAFLLRRSILLGSQVGLRVIGSRFSPDTRRLLEFVARARVPVHWMDTESDREAELLLRQAGVGPDETPVVIAHGHTTLRNPSNRELAEAIGINRPPAGDHADQVLDLLVVGAGPAGLAAAVYGASEGLATRVIDAVAVGGQAGTSTRIENYLGFPAGVSGGELAARAAVQAQKFGALVTSPAEAASVRADGDLHVVRLTNGEELRSRALLLATGARYRRLSVPGIERFEGVGVYYAATQSELANASAGEVAVIGGGNSAGQAAVYLAARVPRVHVLIRRESLADTMSRYLIDQLDRSPAVTVHPGTELREVLGEGGIDGVTVVDRAGGERRLPVRAIFAFIGAEAHTGWLGDYVALDRAGFVLTGADTGEAALPRLATSRRGVFAAGDVRAGSVKRVASAVGEGSMAVSLVHRHLADAFAR